jgi:lipopolysaccharide transport system permease protein
VGLWLSALTAKYRVAFLTGTLVQLWMYATPIIYPVSQIPEKWRWVSSLNPMEMPIVTIRHMFLGQAGGVSGDVILPRKAVRGFLKERPENGTDTKQVCAAV